MRDLKSNFFLGFLPLMVFNFNVFPLIPMGLTQLNSEKSRILAGLRVFSVLKCDD